MFFVINTIDKINLIVIWYLILTIFQILFVYFAMFLVKNVKTTNPIIVQNLFLLSIALNRHLLKIYFRNTMNRRFGVAILIIKNESLGTGDLAKLNKKLWLNIVEGQLVAYKVTLLAYAISYKTVQKLVI